MNDWRDVFLRVALLAGAAITLCTEILGAFHLLRPIPLGIAWVGMAGAGGWYVWRHRPARPAWSWLEGISAVIIAAILAIVGATAWLSPPNSADAMAYHMPRMVYWAQAGSVSFFPTVYFNQISMPPIAEYLMLHTYVLSGGDRLINLIAFLGFFGAIVGVSAAAGALGIGRRGQAFAALFCATLPNAILQASGAKNDSLLAFWLVATVYFAVRRDYVYLGLAAGLALGTKSTAYLFLPPLLVAIAGIRWRAAAAMACGALLINAPQYARNWRLARNPLGFDSAQGNGLFRWRNEHPGWKSTVSNALRHASEQLGGRDPRWNDAVYRAVVRAHGALGLDPQDPDTTWPWARYGPPRNANQEADANNRWHLLILIVAGLLLAARPKGAVSRLLLGLAVSFLLFCFYLKWQPFMARLELPLFILGTIPAGYLLERLRPAVLPLLVGFFLVTNTRLPLLQNWTRPLTGPRSLLRTSRNSNYFSDMSQWNNSASYLQAVDHAASLRCDRVGIDIGQNQLEYPFQALLRQRNPAVRFVHTGVDNATRYYGAAPPRPCAVLCLDCAGIPEKRALYANMGEPAVIGRFLFFSEPRP